MNLRASSALRLFVVVGFGAQAQTPNMIPTRDVVVTYRVVGGDANTMIEMAWLAAQAKLRADVPGLGWSVADLRAGTGLIVVERNGV